MGNASAGHTHTVYIVNDTSYAIEQLSREITTGEVLEIHETPIAALSKETKLFDCKAVHHKFDGEFRYQLTKQKTNSTVMKLFQIEIKIHFDETDITLNTMSVKSLLSEVFPFVIDIPDLSLDQKQIITIRETISPVMSPDTQITSITSPGDDDSSFKDEDAEVAVWSPIISIHPFQRMYKIQHPETCTIVQSQEECFAIAFPQEVAPNITHIRLFSSHNDDAIVNATLKDGSNILLSTTLSYPDKWYEMGADEMETKKKLELKIFKNTTIVMTEDLKLWYRGQHLSSDTYSHNFALFENEHVQGHAIVKIGQSKESLYVLVDNGNEGILHRFGVDQEHIAINGVQDFIEGANHMIVIASNGVIWYQDTHGDFVPDNAMDMTFATPFDIRFLVSNEKSSLLWTWAGTCFVIGSTLGLVEELFSGNKSDFSYTWYQVQLPQTLIEEDIKQIIGCGERFYLLTDQGSVWVSGTDTSTGFYKMKPLALEEVQIPDRVVDISAIGDKLMFLCGE